MHLIVLLIKTVRANPFSQIPIPPLAARTLKPTCCNRPSNSALASAGQCGSQILLTAGVGGCQALVLKKERAIDSVHTSAMGEQGTAGQDRPWHMTGVDVVEGGGRSLRNYCEAGSGSIGLMAV